MTKPKDDGGNATAIDEDLKPQLAEIHLGKVREEFLRTMREKRLPADTDNDALNLAFCEFMATLLTQLDTHTNEQPKVFTAGMLLDTTGKVIHSGIQQVLDQASKGMHEDLVAIQDAVDEAPETAEALTRKLKKERAEMLTKLVSTTVTQCQYEMGIALGAAFIFGASRGKCSPGTVILDMLTAKEARTAKRMLLAILNKELAKEVANMPFMPEELTEGVLAALVKHEATAKPVELPEGIPLVGMAARGKGGLRPVDPKGKEGQRVLKDMLIDTTPGAIKEETEGCDDPECEEHGPKKE